MESITSVRVISHRSKLESPDFNLNPFDFGTETESKSIFLALALEDLFMTFGMSVMVQFLPFILQISTETRRIRKTTPHRNCN